MNAVLQTLRYYFEALLNSPHHLMIYVVVAALLLICIPLLRLIFRSPRRREPMPVEVASPSMLGLNSPADRRRVAVDFAPEPRPIPPKNVRPINESLTVSCTHCGANMSARQDFCPACGYAQPMKQIFTA